MTVCVCVTVLSSLQEVIVRDSSGWDLGPELDHFSSRTRQVLQYMNPNKINMDLLVDLIDYIGTTHSSDQCWINFTCFISVLISLC